jgi:uncharacterized RDD family membrane protein YckC
MKKDRVSTLNIATPEGVTFSVPLAGPVLRSAAYFIDIFVLMGVMKVLGYFLGLLQLLGDVGIGLSILINFAVMEGARMVCELLWRGQTPGKKVMGLRVMDERELKLQPSQVVVRNLLRFVDMLPLFYGLGGVVSLFSSRSQRLGDLAAGTVVVRSVKTSAPDVEGILAGKFNSFREHPNLEARLRQKVAPEEAQLALHALVRREELDPAARVRLYEGLGTLFREKVKFPDETVFGLSDEQYVRNVVETVFRKREVGKPMPAV